MSLILFSKSLLADRNGTDTARMRFEGEDLHKTLCFFRVSGASDGCGDPRFAVDSCSICARSGTEGSK